VNMERFNARERRVLAVGLLVAVVLVVLLGLLVPYVNQYGRYLEAIDDQQFRLERLQTSARQLPVLEEEITDLRDRARAQGYLLMQDTPALAAAAIQEQMGRMVSAEGGEIRSIQVGQPRDEDGFTRVSVTVRMSASIEEMAALFSEIESRQPLMFIDNVQLRVPRARTRRQAASLETGQLELDFEVYAYMHGGSR
jgi:general secretion pathway protein M